MSPPSSDSGSINAETLAATSRWHVEKARQVRSTPQIY